MTSSATQKAVTQPSAGPTQPRRPVVVSRAFQFRFLFPVLVYAGLLFLLTLGLVVLPMHGRIAADPNPVIEAVLRAQLLRIEIWLAPLWIVSGCLAGIVALLYARRVAGPMQCLREGLAKLAVGAPEPVVFRKGDEFPELEPAFAAVAGRMEALTKGKFELLRFLRRNLEGISQRAETESISGAELRESLSVILRDIDAEMKKLQMKS